MDVEGGRGRIRSLDPSELAALARAFRSTVSLLMSPEGGVLVQMGQERLARATFGRVVLGLEPSEMPTYEFTPDDYRSVDRMFESIGEQLARVVSRSTTPRDNNIEELAAHLLDEAFNDAPHLRSWVKKNPQTHDAVRALSRVYASQLLPKTDEDV
jgi:hypothetical protein